MKRDSWHNLPEAFRQRLQEIIPPDTLENVLASFCSHRPTTIRTNTLKTTPLELIQHLTKQGVQTVPVPWSNLAFIVEKPSLRQLSELQLYKEGHFYVQSLSSQIPPLVLDPKPGEIILDIAAAPGSKTTQMAAQMENTGTIIANDNSRIRLYKLRANLEMQGVTNTTVVHMHGQVLWEKYPEYFDRSLVDVPCSMEGRFDCSEPKSYEFWSTKKIRELSERQRFLLRSAVSATKPGGSIVYATCTLAPEENEGVIDWILRKENGVVAAEYIDIPHVPLAPPVLQWKTKTYHEGAQYTKRILPSDTMEGFFVAKLRKLRSNMRSGVAK